MKMPDKNKTVNKEYWENNIEGFAGFYDVQSEETFNSGFWGFDRFYRKAILPLEKKWMLRRHQYVSSYIENHISAGMKAADIGCGSGVYVKAMISQGAFVYALDYANSAIALTTRNLTARELNAASIQLFDITQNHIPPVDVALAIGVLPYITDLDRFLDNILPYATRVLFNYLDRNNIFNFVRRHLTFLDVRNYSYHTSAEITRKTRERGFKVVNVSKLATGFIVEIEKAFAVRSDDMSKPPA
jgi:hypothetical protein